MDFSTNRRDYLVSSSQDYKVRTLEGFLSATTSTKSLRDVSRSSFGTFPLTTGTRRENCLFLSRQFGRFATLLSGKAL